MKCHDFKVSTMDTDSVAFSKKDGAPFSEEEQENLLQELKGIFPPTISWEHDGVYDSVVILKAKNYSTKDKNNKITNKGSSLKSSKLEPALKQFVKELIEILHE